MDADYWIGELGRLYERSSEAIDEGQSNAVEPLTEEFNQALDQLKGEFPENEIISNTDPVDAYTEDNSRSSGSVAVISPPTRRDEALHEIRSRCEKIANALDYELPESESGRRQADQMVMVSVEQEAKQDVDQQVTVDQIMQLVDVDPQVQGNQEEVKELVRKFEDELEQDNPDAGVLRRFIEEAKQYSTSVAAKMAIRALQVGAVGILSL